MHGPLNAKCDRCVDVLTHKQYIEGAAIELLSTIEST